MKDIAWKLSLLGDAAKYDASCASSGSSGRLGAAAGGLPVNRYASERKRASAAPSRRGRGIGSAAPSGICHAWSADGRCISLLKVLLTNVCIYDCAYCINRRSNDIPRASFTVQELIDLTIGFYRRNYIEGLFLSSGIAGDPEYTMRRILSVVKTLRTDRGFNGYIHVKTIPGALPGTIRETGYYADRMSVNIELPAEQSLKFLAPDKSKADIFGPMALIDDVTRSGSRRYSTAGGTRSLPAGANTRRSLPVKPGVLSPYVLDETAPDIVRDLPVPYPQPGSFNPFVPAGQSTQMIVGASPEPDSWIIRLAEGLYRRFGLKRVYYSAYVLVNDDPRLPAAGNPPLLREHRLYQADWLLRFYRFSADELFGDGRGYLDSSLDPKTDWALSKYSLFPVEVKTADYDTLLRVPGIGVISARRIMDARRSGSLSFDSLKKAGVVLKRARYFITCSGRALEGLPERSGCLYGPSSLTTCRSGCRRHPGRWSCRFEDPGIPVYLSRGGRAVRFPLRCF